MSTLDWTKLAKVLDANMEEPADWDTMSPADKEESEYGALIKGVIVDYKKAKVADLVEQMRIEPEPFVIASEADILSSPSPDWLVQDLIQENTIAMLAGPGGLGKSFLALAIARALACGAPFFGKKTKQGKTLYVAAEGVSAFGDRVKAWNEAHNSLTVPADAIAYVKQGVNLKDPQSVEKLAETVATGDYSLVILDTLSQLGYLDNENNNAEVALTFRAIKSIRDAREGTSILVLDHTPVGGGKVRGATSKRDNSDTVIMAIPVGEQGENGFSLSTQNEHGGKQKDGRAIEWHGFALQPVLNSAVVVNNGGKRPLSPYWELCLVALQEGPKSTTELREAAGITGDMRSDEGKRFKRELDHWEKAELVVRGGSKTRPVYTLAPHVAAVAS